MSQWSKSDYPKHLKREERRNVVATDIGWIRRYRKGPRSISEILAPMNGLRTGMGTPDITDIWFSSNTYSLANANTGTLFITYDEPVAFAVNSGQPRIAVANTTNIAPVFQAVGNTAVQLGNATNTIAFDFQVTATGTFRVYGQTVANATANAVSITTLNAGANAASLVFANTVAVLAGNITVTA